MTRPPAAPWYRFPFVWLLVGLPLTAVVAGFTTLYLAITTDDGVVEDDYYKRGKEINRTLERDARAAALGLSGQATVGTGTVMLELRGPVATLPGALRFKFLHATRAGSDQDVEAAQIAPGRYRASVAPFAPGHYYVQVETASWRLNGSYHPGSAAPVALHPGSP